MITWLERVIPAPPEPLAPIEGKESMQAVTRSTAFDPDSWTPQRAANVAAFFDGVAPEWNQRQQSVSRYEPLRDALARGDVPRGRCLEIGSGTGLATGVLRDHFESVIGLDISYEMLVQGSGPRVHCDGNVLPFRDGAFATAVLVNAILFPREVDRVVTDAIVWVSTRGADTPIYLPPEDVAAAMPGDWDGVAAEAAGGTWTVLRRG